MFSVIMSEYWVISAPGDKTCQQTWDTLNNATKSGNLSINYKFPIPDLKVSGPSIQKWIITTYNVTNVIHFGVFRNIVIFTTCKCILQTHMNFTNCIALDYTQI